MCVILVCPAHVRPDRATLEACHAANPHGAGVAWRDGDEVRWLKGLDPDELNRCPKLPGEIVIHFRMASVGRWCPALCHPFPVTRRHHPPDRPCPRRALPQRHVDGLAATLRWMPGQSPPGPALRHPRCAILVDLCGMDTLERLPGRWVFFERDFTESSATGTVARHAASNLHFLPPSDSPGGKTRQNALLPFPGTCGNSGHPRAPHVPPQTQTTHPKHKP
jgi:hypothetical protein